MDLIFTNADREDQGVLLNYDLDLAFGKNENDFECRLLAEAHCCEPGSLLYIEGTEYGGVVDNIESNSTTREVVYSGRTWHGIMASKVIEPLHENEIQGEDSTFEIDGITIHTIDNQGNSYVESYLVVSGDVNDCLRFILNRCALSPFVVATEGQAGVAVNKFKFDRYTDAYSGLIKMLKRAGLKMEIAFKNGQVTVGATAKHDYTAQEEFDSDLIEFTARKNYKTVNHLICLGTGELAERTVVHLFADEFGNVSEQQTQFGFDEFTAVYDYPNAESYEELVDSGEVYLKQLWATDQMSVDFDATDDTYGIGDIVGAYDNVTGLAVAAEIIKKIVTIKNGQTTISYEVGD